MISKPEKIIKRIIKAVGQRQAVLVIGDWDPFLIKGMQENQNTISIESSVENLEDNSYTRIIADYSHVIARKDEVLTKQSHYVKQSGDCFVANASRNDIFFTEARRLLLPTGMIIISANREDGLLEKITKLFKKKDILNEEIKKIKPKILQDQIHDNDFLIDGYYGYPGGHLLMMAQIQNKEVATLFTHEKQETLRG